MAKIGNMRFRSREIAAFCTGILVMIYFLGMYQCAAHQKKSIVDSSYKALNISGNVYDIAMTAIGNLYKQGLIDESVKEEAIGLGDKYYDIYHSAVEALKAYKETPADMDTVQQKMLNAGIALGKLLSYVNPILQKHGIVPIPEPQ